MPAEEKAGWLRFLESSGGTALITVVLGGIVGSAITALVQSGLKEREFQQAWLKARGDQALAAYQQYAESELKTVEKSYDLIGRMLAAAENLISLTEPRFDLAAFAGEDQVRVREQRLALRREYNEADATWRRNREVLGLLMAYYHPGGPQVRAAWRSVQDAVDGYAACALAWYTAHREPSDSQGACRTEQQRVQQALDGLNGAIESARQYPWEGWESPERMQQRLGQSVEPSLSPRPASP
jgi:hypothetical protein